LRIATLLVQILYLYLYFDCKSIYSALVVVELLDDALRSYNTSHGLVINSTSRRHTGITSPKARRSTSRKLSEHTSRGVDALLTLPVNLSVVPTPSSYSASAVVTTSRMLCPLYTLHLLCTIFLTNQTLAVAVLAADVGDNMLLVDKGHCFAESPA
jgi:hypothetical protein